MRGICAREEINKVLNKYIAGFDHVDQTLLVLLAASGVISITSFATIFFW